VDGTVNVRQAESVWQPFEPRRDGQPLLASMSLYHAQLAGNVLSLALGRPGERMLALYRGPDGTGLGETELYSFGGAFTLSADGRLLARRQTPRDVVVSETANPGVPLVTATLAGLHNRLDVWVDADPFRMSVRVGGYHHAFCLDRGELWHSLVRDREPGAPPNRVPAGKSVPRYDGARFPADWSVLAAPWVAVFDRLGQVLLYAGGPDPVAAFVVRRDRAAVWIPGDVFWGDPGLIGGPPTPDAARKIGRAILTAGGG
jgi:hypothetical protein